MKGAQESTSDTCSSRSGSEVLSVAGSGAWNLGGAVFNQALRFGITWLIAQVLGQSDTGLYYQALGLQALLGLVAAGGFTISITHFIAAHRARGDIGGVRGTVRVGLVSTTVGATAVGVLLYVLAPWLSVSVFHSPRLEIALRLVAVALPASVYTDVALSATQGFKIMRPYALINLFFEPTMRIALTGIALRLGLGLRGVMIALLVTNYSAAILSTLALRRLMGRPTSSPRYSFRELYGFSAVSWLGSLTSSGLTWADTIMLGIFASAADVGVYQVSTRLVLLGTIFIQPVTTSFAPRISDLYTRGQLATLQKLFVLITSWIFRLALPAFVVLIVFARDLLALFGRGFTVGATVTVLLAVGQMINSATGPGGYMLIMSGRPVLQLFNNLGALVLNVAANLWVLPRYGIIGAGASWAATIVIFNVVRVIEVYKIFGIVPFERGLAKGVVGGVAAFGAGISVHQVIGAPLALPVGIATVATVYAGAIALLGINEEDRLVLRTLQQRLRR